jgi:hypothetical protein
MRKLGLGRRARHGCPLWDPETGVWVLLDVGWAGVDGTTPRNADVWTLSLRAGGRERWGTELWLRAGRHWGAQLWVGAWNAGWHARSKGCQCYDCVVAGGPVRWYGR